MWLFDSATCPQQKKWIARSKFSTEISASQIELVLREWLVSSRVGSTKSFKLTSLE